MNNQIQNDMEAIASNTQIMADFVAKYGAAIPDGLANLSCSTKPRLSIDLDYQDAKNTERALATIGEIFGRSGWTSKQNAYKSNHRDWEKTIDGVFIKVDGAEKFPAAEERLVAPVEFPLMLTEA